MGLEVGYLLALEDLSLQGLDDRIELAVFILPTSEVPVPVAMHAGAGSHELVFSALGPPRLRCSLTLCVGDAAGLLLSGLVILSAKVGRQLADLGFVQLKEHVASEGCVLSHSNHCDEVELRRGCVDLGLVSFDFSSEVLW